MKKGEKYMEKKLVRFTSYFTCIFSLFVFAAVWVLPTIRQRVEAFSAGIIEDRRAREERYALLEKMSGLEILDYNTQKVQEKAEKVQAAEERGEIEAVDEVIVITHQMQLEMPKGTKPSKVQIAQKYVDQKIEISIPGADENYMYDYQLLGKTDDIKSLDYFSGSDGGSIVLTMDKVVEVQSSYDQDYLYLDFFSPKELYDRVVVVDAGHGGRAPGAVSGDKYEKDITLAIVQQIKALFDEAKDPTIRVYYTRLDDSNPDFSNRVGLANNSGADLFVSVHINSVKGSTDVEGIEVMYDELAADTAFDTKDFAQICLDEEVKALGAKKRRVVAGNKIYIIRNSNAPVALVEVGFMNNPTELARLLDTSYQKKAAEGIYNALIKSLDQLDELDKKEKK